jgi:hypothetical protein
MRLSLSLSILSPNLTSLAGFMNVMLVSRSFENRYIETVKVLTNNPFVSIPLETVKGWLEAEPQK